MPPTRTRTAFNFMLCAYVFACVRAAADAAQAGTPSEINGFHMLCPLRVDPSALYGAEPEAPALAQFELDCLISLSASLTRFCLLMYV